MRRSSTILSSNLPLYTAVANELRENFISMLEGGNSILFLSQVDEEDIFTGTDSTRANDLLLG